MRLRQQTEPPPNPRRFIPQLWHNVGELWGWARDRGYKNEIRNPRCRWQFSSNYGAIVCPPLAKLPLNNPFPAIKSKGNSSRVSGIAPPPDPQFSIVRIIQNLSCFKKSFQIHPQVTTSYTWTTTLKATGSTGLTMRKTKTMESLGFDLMEAIVSKS